MKQTYSGGCQCGAVAFEAAADLSTVTACNCSRCSKLGWLIAFVPAVDFTLMSGADQVTEYRFNKKHIAHLFCNTCGIESYARGTGSDGSETIALNVRCLNGVDVGALALHEFNGKDI
jgi:hypothetical protein